MHRPNSKHYIVVDDDKITCTHIESILLRKNIRCTTFNDIASAKTFLTTNVVDLIFLDLSFPKDNGFSLMKFVSSDPKLEQVPIIVISSNNNEVTIIKAIKMGAVDYILKPVRPWILLEKMSKRSQENKAVEHLDVNVDEEVEVICNASIIKINPNNLIVDAPVKFVKIGSMFTLENEFLEHITEKDMLCQVLSPSYSTLHGINYSTNVQMRNVTEEDKDEIGRNIIRWT